MARGVRRAASAARREAAAEAYPGAGPPLGGRAGPGRALGAALLGCAAGPRLGGRIVGPCRLGPGHTLGTVRDRARTDSRGLVGGSMGYSGDHGWLVIVGSREATPGTPGGFPPSLCGEVRGALCSVLEEPGRLGAGGRVAVRSVPHLHLPVDSRSDED